MIQALSQTSVVGFALGAPEIIVILFVLGFPVAVVLIVLAIVKNSNKNKGE